MHKTVLKIFGLLILLMTSLAGLSQKTDKVFLKNGNTLTGEIKSLKFAKLSFDMDGPGDIQIKWKFIVKIESDKTFQVTMRKGDVLITKVDSLFFEEQHAVLDDIVEIVQIRDRFLKRMDGDVNLGFNYAKSNSILQFNLNSSVTYRKPKTETNFKLNAVISDNSTDSIKSKKEDASLDNYRALKKMYYVNIFFGWQKNSELGLDNRFLLSLGGGKIITNNNRRRLLTGGGISYNVEQANGSTNYKSNLEALLAIQYKQFRYTTPKLSIDTKFVLFPSLSDWGRIRMDFNVNTKYEIFKDFNVGLSFYDSYDNRPASTASSKNDFGVNFTVGYEFGK